jgi:hypothetical protein
MWWTKWHRYRFFSNFFAFPYQYHPTDFFLFYFMPSLHHGSPYSHIIWGMNNRPIGGRSSETWCHPIDINNIPESTYLFIKQRSVRHKLSTTPRSKLFSFVEEFTGTKVTNRKNCLSSDSL